MICHLIRRITIIWRSQSCINKSFLFLFQAEIFSNFIYRTKGHRKSFSLYAIPVTYSVCVHDLLKLSVLTCLISCLIFGESKGLCMRRKKCHIYFFFNLPWMICVLYSLAWKDTIAKTDTERRPQLEYGIRFSISANVLE